MIHYKKYTLENGLRVIAHRDQTTPMSVFNILYDVGSRDEDPARTGFAHLFEHLMFEGSVHIPDFDVKLQLAGGENNAFTSSDITDYYMMLPALNLETAFWLESDRMFGLSFSEEKLGIQKNVVSEEYHQSYLNQPYGDTMLLLRPLCYRVHPYQWATIGKSIEHVQTAGLNEVKAFYSRHYRPENAILSVSGPVDEQEVFHLAKKWFGEIPTGSPHMRSLPEEPIQTQQRRLTVERDVPASQIYIAFHTCGRQDPEFFASDLLSDILSHGESSRLKERLVKDKKIFSEVDAYLSGSIDTGMFIIAGKFHPDRSVEEAENALWLELEDLAVNGVYEMELQKVKNKLEAAHCFSESNILARTMNLAYYECLGDAGLLNDQVEQYFRVSQQDIKEMACDLFRKDAASVMHYMARNGS